MESTTETGAEQQIATRAHPARLLYRLVPSRCSATAAPIDASQATPTAATPGVTPSSATPRISIGYSGKNASSLACRTWLSSYV